VCSDAEAEPMLNHANVDADKFDGYADYVSSLNYEQYMVHDRRINESRMAEVRERDN
jgi:hypothetical protein